MKKLEQHTLDYLYSYYDTPGVLVCGYYVMDWMLDPHPKEIIQNYLAKCSLEEYSFFLQEILKNEPVNAIKLLPILGVCNTIPKDGSYTIDTVYRPEIQCIKFEIEKYYKVKKITDVK